MFWAGIAYDEKIDLVPIQGTMNTVKYRDEIINGQILLVDDNCQPYRARIVSAHLQQHGIERMNPWPRQVLRPKLYRTLLVLAELPDLQEKKVLLMIWYKIWSGIPDRNGSGCLNGTCRP